MMPSIAEWDDPFAKVDALIQTPEEAQRWLHWVGLWRSIALLPANEWEVPWERQVTDPRLLALIRDVHRATRDPRNVTDSVCSIDLWAIRTRAEWGLL